MSVSGHLREGQDETWFLIGLAPATTVNSEFEFSLLQCSNDANLAKKDSHLYEMKRCNTANCDLDLDAYTVHVKDPLVFEGGTCHISIQLIDHHLQKQTPETGRLEIQLPGEGKCLINYESLRIEASAYQSNDWNRFMHSCLVQLIDLVVAGALFSEEQDILWIEPGSAGKVWVLYLVQSGVDKWLGHLVEIAPPKIVDTSYALLGTGQQSENLKSAFADFKSWLPGQFFQRVELAPDKRLLTIKVNPSELWFLRFPISAFCQLQYEGFLSYWDVEWIVTDKGFIQTTGERLRLREEISDPLTFFEHAIVVVNTYSEHQRIESCTQATELVIEILSIFENLDFQTHSVSLRWYLNPSASELNQLLLDDVTFYFFGDFEASNGLWQVGEGQTLGWHGANKSQPSRNSTESGSQYFWPEYGNNILSHIRLMRVYHCNSIFDPFQAFLERDPADHHTIVRRFLDAGVQRVEGGMTAESYFDYLCSLIDMLCRPEQFKLILKLKCLERDFDYRVLNERINNFLTTQKRDLIAA